MELNELDGSPSDLWLRGREELIERGPRVAIVGSRAPSPYGREQARRFGEALAARGVVVVSGMARGIDEAAHLGALDANGDTLAVLGSSVDRPWPDGPLCERLAREGLLVSEFPPGQGPRRHHFPLRNRLISGLSLAVLVVEAAERSGSLITARWALDQGRGVYALPGRVDQPQANGTLGLLREGATPVGSPDDLLADLFGRGAVAAVGTSVTGAVPSSAAHRAPEDELCEELVGETLGLDELAHRTGQPMGELLARLAELELAGRVTRAPGGLYGLRH